MNNQNWKKRSVAVSSLLAALALGCYAYSRFTAPPTYRLANGISVTSIAVIPSDSDRLLEVYNWKFDVFLPDQTKPLYLSLVEYHNGKFVKTLIGGIECGVLLVRNNTKKSHLYHVTIGIAPDGETLTNAKQLKYIIDSGGSSTSGLMPNICLHNSSSAIYSQISSPDNIAYLMSLNTSRTNISSNADTNETALALRIETTPPN